MTASTKKTIIAKIGDSEYALTFGMGTMMEAEEYARMSALDLVSSGSLSHYATLFWAVLQPQHPMTRAEAVDLIDRAGINQVIEWIGKGVGGFFEGFKASVATAKASEAKGKAAPKKAA